MQRNKTKGVANLPVQVHRPTTEIISAVADLQRETFAFVGFSSYPVLR